eukprot:TRINITY_DN14278_c0_g1_i1.p1 TRINITY_DN14278_c0_g1~~TRINITY_DN14278_c0_g1_i1.p1  ORF type:complete len:860 (-),score=148.09 TRINITY_DN14278_c0_g1_i1:1-2259(-)
MTCVYIMTRLAPIALQNPSSGFAEYVFWSSDEEFGNKTEITEVVESKNPVSETDSASSVATDTQGQVSTSEKEQTNSASSAPEPQEQETNSASSEKPIPAAETKEQETESVSEKIIEALDDNGAGVGSVGPTEDEIEDVKETEGLVTPEAPSAPESDPVPVPEPVEVEEELNYGPVGHILIDCLLKLLFSPPFGVSAQPEAHEGKEVLHSFKFPSTYATDCSRAEILLCILACCSGTLFYPPERETSEVPGDKEKEAKDLGQVKGYKSLPNKFIHYLIDIEDGCSHKYASMLVTSLLQSIVGYDPIGWGVPYNHVLFYDVKEKLMERSLHLLCLLLDYTKNELKLPATMSTSLGASPAFHPAPTTNTGSGIDQYDNLFVYLINQLSETDYSTMLRGICSKLENPIMAANTWMPGSTKMVKCNQEFLLLTWQLMRRNRNFFRWMVRDANVVDLVYAILHFVNDARKDPSRTLIVQLSIFILFDLSSERSFSTALNKPLIKPVKTDVKNDVNVTYADFLIATLARLVLDGNPSLQSLWEYCLVTLSNISAFVTNVSKTSGVKLLRLFQALTQPKFLYEHPLNYRFCFFLLEIFNNVLQYQYHGNIEGILYNLVRARRMFQALITFQTGQEGAEGEVLTKSSNVPVPEWATEEWLLSWKNSLPIQTVLVFLNSVVPSIKGLYKGTATDEQAVLTFLRQTTLVGILPLPHPILLRQFFPLPQAYRFVNEYLWSLVFLSTLETDLFGSLAVRLFLVK